MRSPSPVKTPPDACLSCGTPADPGQEYCLGCGARIVAAPRFSTAGRVWERRLGRYPGDWIWASLALLLVAAGSATAGIVAGQDTGSTAAPDVIIATSPVVTAPPQPPACALHTAEPDRKSPPLMQSRAILANGAAFTSR